MGKNAQKLVLIFCVCAIFLKIFGISIDIVATARVLNFHRTISVITSIVDLCGMLLLTYWGIKTKTRFMLL